MCWWVLFVKGLGSAAHEAFDKPGLLMLVFVVTVLSAGFHEFGHAAAARRGGSTPGAMGAGIYLVWPAFYTDVTDSYRLGRGGRLRTDLGGLYFNAIVALVDDRASGGPADTTRCCSWSRRRSCRWSVSSPRLVRFDGYHVLADLTGVPDLFHRIKPTLLGVLPWRWRDPEATALKPWARAVVTIWVVARRTPVCCSPCSRWSSPCRGSSARRGPASAKQQDLMAAPSRTTTWSRCEPSVGDGRAGLPGPRHHPHPGRLVLGIVRSSWQRTKGKPMRRAGTALLAAALVAGLADRGGPGRQVPADHGVRTRHPRRCRQHHPARARPAPTGLATGSTGRSSRPGPTATPGPPANDPSSRWCSSLAAAIPRPSRGSSPSTSLWSLRTTTRPCRSTPRTTRSGTTSRSPCLGGGRLPRASAQRVVRVRELHRLRGGLRGFPGRAGHGRQPCRGPAEHRGGGQLRLRRLSDLRPREAALRDPRRPAHPGRAEELARLWQEIAAYGANIADVPLSEIQARLNDFEEQIMQIIEKDQGPLTSSTPSPSPTPRGTTTPGGTPTPPSDGPTTDPSDGSGTQSGAPTDDPTPAPEPSTEPTSDPSPAGG